MHDHPCPLCVPLHAHRFHRSRARVSSVARDAIEVLAPEALRAMVAEAAAQQREHLRAAVLAGEPVVGSADEVGSSDHSPPSRYERSRSEGWGSVCSPLTGPGLARSEADWPHGVRGGYFRFLLPFGISTEVPYRGRDCAFHPATAQRQLLRLSLVTDRRGSLRTGVGVQSHRGYDRRSVLTCLPP